MAFEGYEAENVNHAFMIFGHYQGESSVLILPKSSLNTDFGLVFNGRSLSLSSMRFLTGDSTLGQANAKWYTVSYNETSRSDNLTDLFIPSTGTFL